MGLDWAYVGLNRKQVDTITTRKIYADSWIIFEDVRWYVDSSAIVVRWSESYSAWDTWWVVCLWSMIKDIEELEKLNMTMHKKLLMDLILQSLIHSLWNYYMNKYYSTLTELINMLVNKGSWKVQRYILGEPKESFTCLQKVCRIAQNWSYNFFFIRFWCMLRILI